MPAEKDGRLLKPAIFATKHNRSAKEPEVLYCAYNFICAHAASSLCFRRRAAILITYSPTCIFLFPCSMLLRNWNTVAQFS